MKYIHVIDWKLYIDEFPIDHGKVHGSICRWFAHQKNAEFVHCHAPSPCAQTWVLTETYASPNIDTEYHRIPRCDPVEPGIPAVNLPINKFCDSSYVTFTKFLAVQHISLPLDFGSWGVPTAKHKLNAPSKNCVTKESSKSHSPLRPGALLDKKTSKSWAYGPLKGWRPSKFLRQSFLDQVSDSSKLCKV